MGFERRERPDNAEEIRGTLRRFGERLGKVEGEVIGLQRDLENFRVGLDSHLNHRKENMLYRFGEVDRRLREQRDYLDGKWQEVEEHIDLLRGTDIQTVRQWFYVMAGVIGFFVLFVVLFWLATGGFR